MFCIIRLKTSKKGNASSSPPLLRRYDQTNQIEIQFVPLGGVPRVRGRGGGRVRGDRDGRGRDGVRVHCKPL